MNSATLNFNILTKRMLTKKEDASHCGRPEKRFLIECPVAPVKFGNGDLRYDLHDLDNWLDNLKQPTATAEIDAVLARL